MSAQPGHADGTRSPLWERRSMWVRVQGHAGQHTTARELRHAPGRGKIRAPMAGIHITDIESAINYWRDRKPSADGITLAGEVRVLAEVYALMVYHHETLADEFTFPRDAFAVWLAWYDTTPDTPCIAICSTSQGDAICKGCGRSFEEVQHWTEMRPVEKRATWRRITHEGTAWRFNRYAERAAERKTRAQ